MPARPALPDTETCVLGICDGSGFLVDEEANEATVCACRRERTRRRGGDLSAVIPRRYRNLSFDRPPLTEIDERTVGQVKRFVRNLDANLDSGRGLWLYGNVGTGKTSLAMLVSAQAIEAGRSVAIYSVPRLLAEIRMTFDDATERSYVDLLDRLAAVDLLHLDDLGAEKTSAWVLEQLYAIVNARYEEERSVIITTNLERDPLIEQINERTVSRLSEMCDLVPLHGEDRRSPFSFSLKRASGDQ